MTTGHEWNGIKELNTPVPRVVYFFLIVTVAFSMRLLAADAALPLGSATKGLLGIDQRTSVAKSLDRAAADRAAWGDEIAAAS